MNQGLLTSIDYLEKVVIELHKYKHIDVYESLAAYSAFENIKIHFYRSAIRKHQFQEALTTIYSLIDKQRSKGILTFETCHYLYISFTLVNQYINGMIW